MAISDWFTVVNDSSLSFVILHSLKSSSRYERAFCGGWSHLLIWFSEAAQLEQISSQAADIIQEKETVLKKAAQSSSDSFSSQSLRCFSSSKRLAITSCSDKRNTHKSSIQTPHGKKQNLLSSFSLFVMNKRPRPGGPGRLRRPSCSWLTDGRRWRSRASGWRGWSCLQVREGEQVHTETVQHKKHDQSISQANIVFGADLHPSSREECCCLFLLPSLCEAWHPVVSAGRDPRWRHHLTPALVCMFLTLRSCDQFCAETVGAFNDTRKSQIWGLAPEQWLYKCTTQLILHYQPQAELWVWLA